MTDHDQQSEGVDSLLARHGKVSYLEIPAIDAEASATFYEAFFGWQVERRGPENVSFFDGAGELLGRWMLGRAVATEPGFLPYIYVDDVEAIVKRIEVAGGAIERAPYAEGNLIVATFRDPAGNLVGVWQAS